MNNLDQLQAEIGEWHLRHFPEAEGQGAWMPLAKAMSELGELADSHLSGKLAETAGNAKWQGHHDAAAKDAIADTIIALIGYASRRGWSVSELLEDVWFEVKNRAPQRVRP